MSTTRVCRVCRELLPGSHFHGAHQTCEHCHEVRTMAKPWTVAEYERVRQAATVTARCWPANVDVIDDVTRASLRALINALDRRVESAS